MAVRREISVEGRTMRQGVLLLSSQQMQVAHFREGQRERKGRKEWEGAVQGGPHILAGATGQMSGPELGNPGERVDWQGGEMRTSVLTCLLPVVQPGGCVQPALGIVGLSLWKRSGWEMRIWASLESRSRGWVRAKREHVG